MSGRGRHARTEGLGFYRDLLLLLGGIVVVAALVFGGMSLWAGGSDDDLPTPAASPTSTQAETTTHTSLITTVLSTTSTVPTTLATTSPPDTPTSTAADTTATLREARPPSEVRVIVLNSIGVTGLAGGLSDQLAEQGYQVREASNYTPELSDSMVFHADGFSVEALNLSQEVPDATVAPDPELAAAWGVDVVVVIGRSYQE